METCARCRTFAADLGRTHEVLDLVSVADPRWGFSDRVAAQIADVPPNTAWTAAWARVLRPLPMGVGVAAFCLGVALVSLANGQPGPAAVPRTDAVALLADNVLGVAVQPALEEELANLVPWSEE